MNSDALVERLRARAEAPMLSRYSGTRDLLREAATALSECRERERLYLDVAKWAGALVENDRQAAEYAEKHPGGSIGLAMTQRTYWLRLVDAVTALAAQPPSEASERSGT